ncbi:MAG: hypothetical protein H9533_11620 [Rhodobacteraceae bacterium]|nr:hypothetical protein [Paracoccaceae bacterium]
MLEASPRWNRQRLAVLEAVELDLNRMFSVLYFSSVACAVVYMAGWLRFNLLDLPVGPLSFHTTLTLGLTAVAGLGFALLLPTIVVAAGIERKLQRRIRRFDPQAGSTTKHRLIAVQALPNLKEAVGGTHGQHHHQKP